MIIEIFSCFVAVVVSRLICKDKHNLFENLIFRGNYTDHLSRSNMQRQNRDD